MDGKENSSKQDPMLESSASKSQTTRSNFFSMTHPSVNSRDKDDLFRRIRSGNDVLCSLPSRLDPNIQFSDDEDDSSAEIQVEKPVVYKTPHFRSSQSYQLPIRSTLEPSVIRKVNQTPSSSYYNQHHFSASKSSTLDPSMRRLFPSSASKTSSTDILLRKDGFKRNFVSRPEVKTPTPAPHVFQVPSQKEPPNPEEQIVVNGKQYRVLSLLGSGGSCKVYSVFDTEKKSLVAIKCVDLKNTDEIIREGYKKEIEYLKQLQNSNRVIRMFDYQHSGQELFIVLERGDIDLAKYLSNEVKLRSLTPLKIKFYWNQMLEAVNDIHKHGIVHSDLKPANFLLVAGNLKLIDFGIATSVPDDKTSAFRDTYIGTLNYMSPEAVTQSSGSSTDSVGFKVSVKSDVWSLGCILYNLVYGETPFQNLRNMVQKINAITNPNYKIVFKPISDELLLDVLQLCLKRNPKERASVDELLRHPYLAEDKASTSTGTAKSKDLQNVMKQMKDLTPRRMSYLTRVVQELTGNEKDY